MIDTDKYEGHNTDDRIWHQYSEGLTSDYTDGRSRADEADARLAADAPLLLAEVKRLREQLMEAKDWVRIEGRHRFETSEDRLKHYKEYIGDEEE